MSMFAVLLDDHREQARRYWQIYSVTGSQWDLAKAKFHDEQIKEMTK